MDVVAVPNNKQQKVERARIQPSEVKFVRYVKYFTKATLL